MTGTRIWALGTTVVIIAVLALGYLLGVSPMMTRLSAAEQELATTEANNQAQLGTLQIMKAQYEDLAALEDELEVLRISVPGAIDTDFVYSLLASYQNGTGTNVTAITTGEAQPYGMTSEGTETTVGAASIPNLYTVPVTITFTGNSPSQVMAYVAAMQRGPRLFLVTAVSGSASGEEGAAANGEQSSTVTAYMFILADPNATADDAGNALLEHGFDFSLAATPLGPKPSGSPTPTPMPSESATPTPTPTGTPAP